MVRRDTIDGGRWPLHVRMTLGVAAGIVAGTIAHAWLAGDPRLESLLRWVVRPVGQLFLRALFMLVLPLVVSALALGVAQLGDLRTLGRVGLRTLVYTVTVSAIAVLLGVGLANLLQPGVGLSEDAKARLLEGAAERAAGIAQAPSRAGMDLLVQIVPSNPVKAAAEGDMLAVMFFALMLGVGLAMVRTDGARALESALEGLYDVAMRLIRMILAVAPWGVAALLFAVTADVGWEVLIQLARYVGVVVLALATHQFVVYPIVLRTVGKTSPRAFFRAVQPAMATAFSTASSNASLPTALEVAEDRLLLPPHIARFVLTIGATANQNGTALFEGVTVLFLAQVYGVELSVAQQFTVVAISVLGGIGTAGVPAGSIPVVAMILGLVGVPPEGIGLVLGVDRFLDMCRTTLNVTGDLAAAVVVSRLSAGDHPA